MLQITLRADDDDDDDADDDDDDDDADDYDSCFSSQCCTAWCILTCM